MLTLDGNVGEGGGQILRTALALSLVLGQPFRVVNLRARRARPGLRPQHLVCVHAAAAVGGAEVTGAAIGSRDLTFSPRRVEPGDYRFDIGSAGSTTLVAQTILPALTMAERPSRLVISGGTHNPLAPPYEFLARAFLPLLVCLGARVEADLARPGYYPRGGGELVLRVTPGGPRTPLDLCERGPPRGCRATAAVADLPRHIAERELAVVARELGWAPSGLRVRIDPTGSGPGNVLVLEMEYARVTEVVAAFGRRGVPAEVVAVEAVREARAYLAGEAPVGSHLGDQLLLPLALAGGAFVTSTPSLHATTNAEVIGRFLADRLSFAEISPGLWRVEAPARRSQGTEPPVRVVPSGTPGPRAGLGCSELVEELAGPSGEGQGEGCNASSPDARPHQLSPRDGGEGAMSSQLSAVPDLRKHRHP